MNKIPKNIVHKGKKYTYVCKCNNNLFLYESVDYGYKMCFTRFELGLLQEVPEAVYTSAHRNKF